MKNGAVGFLVAAAAFGALLLGNANAADTIYHNGPVVTMDDSLPVAEAVAVTDGRIVAVGDRSAVLALATEATHLVDLDGRTLLPGFVESHGHAYMMGIQAATANLLPPPDGEGSDIESLQRLLTAWTEENAGIVEADRLDCRFRLRRFTARRTTSPHAAGTRSGIHRPAGHHHSPVRAPGRSQQQGAGAGRGDRRKPGSCGWRVPA
jgi:hypothetical protein